MFFNKVFAQVETRFVTIQLGAVDFWTPQTGNIFISKSKYNSRYQIYWDPSVLISYQNTITSGFQIETKITLSNLFIPSIKNDTLYQKYKSTNRTNPTYQSKQYEHSFIYLQQNILYSIFENSNHRILPQIQGGLGYFYHKNNSGVTTNFGLNIITRLYRQVYANAEASYHYTLNNRYQNFFQYGIGIKIPLKRKFNNVLEKSLNSVQQNSQKPISKEINTNYYFHDYTKNMDTDGDGIFDIEDQCPKVKGVVSAMGCPDADNDGVPDHKDLCPFVYAKTANGCPDNMEEAKTLNVSNKPNDTIVKEVEQASKMIQFNSGTDYLLPSAYPALKKIVEIIISDTLLQVTIEGYSDNTGQEDENIMLSQKRADACKKYFIAKGVKAERITSIGYGDMNPIADNETIEGRATNRRTEIHLSYDGE